MPSWDSTASSELLRYLFDSAEDPYLIHDPDGVIVDANRAAMTLLGYSLKEFHDNFIWPNDLVRAFRKLIDGENERSLTLEADLGIESGPSLSVEVFSRPILQSDSPLIISRVRDMSRLRRVEADIRKRTRRLEKLLESSRLVNSSLEIDEVLTNIAFSVKQLLDAQGCTIYLLDESGEMLIPKVAIDPDYEVEILTTPLPLNGSFTGLAIRRKKGIIFNDATENGRGMQIPGTPLEQKERVMVVPFVLKDCVLGAMCLDRVGQEFSNDELSLAEAFAAHVTVTVSNARQYQKQLDVDKAITEKEEKYRSVLENTPYIICFLKADGTAEYVNSTIEVVTGYKPDEIIGNNWWEVFYPGEYEKREYLVREWKPGKAEYAKYERVMLAKDGSEKLILWTAKYHYDKNDELTEIIGIGEDITERKDLKLELFQAQKMEAVGTIAGGIAHDFNNILSAIVGNAEYIRSSNLLNNDSEAVESIKNIIDAAEDGTRLVRQLMEFAHKGTGDLNCIDLNMVIEDTVKLLKHTMPSDIEFKLELDNDLPLIFANRNDIQHIIINLSINARDSMSNVGTIVIKTDVCETAAVEKGYFKTRYSKYIQLQVSDTGIGIPAENLDRIFDPFFTTKEKGMGTGLGLSTVYRQVHAFGGTISVDSEEGVGTTFTIIFPAVFEEDRA